MALQFLLHASGSGQIFGCSVHMKRYSTNVHHCGSSKMRSTRCLASKQRGFGMESGSKEKGKSSKKPQDSASELSEVIVGDGRSKNRQSPDLGTGSGKKSSKGVLDKKFLERVEAVRRSALEKKKADENKVTVAIDYEAPVESNKTEIGFGAKVGIGVAVLAFGLVFAFGDFLPSGSVSTDKETNEVTKQLTAEEKKSLERQLQGFEATLSKLPKDPIALEGAAVTLVDLGEYDKASTLLEKLVKETPKNAETYRLIGEVKYQLRDYDASASAYRSSLSVSSIAS